jgi:hypothetical protein
VGWQAVKLASSDALAVRASKKLRSDETLVLSLGATILRKHLDDVPLWRGDHVAVKQLIEDFARYLYLPRIAGPEVLVQAMRDGVALLTWQSDSFAYAESHDEVGGRYRGLRSAQAVSISEDNVGVLVKPDVARHQMDAETKPAVPAGPSVGGPTGVGPGTGTGTGGGQTGQGTGTATGGGTTTSGGGAPTKVTPRRFYGTVVVDPARAGRDAGRIADEVIAHLVGQLGAEVTVTIEIQAKLPRGASDQLVRTVTENSRTLKFTSHGFEAE